MKKYVSGIITGFLLCLGVTVFAAVPMVRQANFTDTVAIEINSIRQDMEIVSVVKQGDEDARNYASIYDLAIAMGAEVTWDGVHNVIGISTSQQKEAVQLLSQSTPQVQQQIKVVTYVDPNEWINIKEFARINDFPAFETLDMHYFYAFYSAGRDAGMGQPPILTVDSREDNPRVRVIRHGNDPFAPESYYYNKSDLLREGFKVE